MGSSQSNSSVSRANGTALRDRIGGVWSMDTSTRCSSVIRVVLLRLGIARTTIIVNGATRTLGQAKATLALAPTSVRLALHIHQTLLRTYRSREGKTSCTPPL